MSDHEQKALNALRSLDGPADLGDGTEARIETAVLARFDRRVVGAGSVDDDTRVLVALDDTHASKDRWRSNRFWAVATAAATVAVIVAGAVAAMARDEPAPSNPPPAAVSTTVVSTVVSTAVDDAGVVEQLSAFCDEFVVPLRDADARWQPSDMETEAFAGVLIAAEQAADAMTQLTGPLGERLSASAEQALDVATDARLALSVGRSDTVDAIAAARDLILAAPAASGASQLPASCQP